MITEAWKRSAAYIASAQDHKVAVGEKRRLTIPKLNKSLGLFNCNFYFIHGISKEG